MHKQSVDFELGPSPVASLGIVSNLVVGLVAEPIRQRPVLTLSLGESLLHEQCFVGTHQLK